MTECPHHFDHCIRACLGPVPNMAARPLLPGLAQADEVPLRYEWVRDWEAVAALDFHDGAEWITFLRPH